MNPIMNISSILLTIIGLGVFETISSIDNAIINAEVAATMGKKARRWFLTWGLFFAVFVIRGLLPWLIVWISAPSLGPIGTMVATFSNDPAIKHTIEAAAPTLLIGGGIFLLLLFLHWLMLEEKEFGLPGEKKLLEHGVWFYALASLLLLGLVVVAQKHSPSMVVGALIGSTAFFITHGFKQYAEASEKKLIQSNVTDISKILYLEIIDATFSIDGVLGAFAFTLSVPIILAGNGLGAFVVRQLTMGNIDRIKKYIYLKNGAMYSILFLGLIMILDSFETPIPDWVSPVITLFIISLFFAKSYRHLHQHS